MFTNLIHRRCGNDRLLQAQAGWRFKRPATKFFQHVDVSAHFGFVRTKDDRRVFGNELSFVGFKQRLIEAVPAACAAGLDDLLKGSVF